MKNNIKYSEFEYKKVLAALEFIESQIENKKYYTLQILTFEDEFEATNFFALSEMRTKDTLDSLNLVYATVCLGEDGNPILSFMMSQKSCAVSIEYDEMAYGKDFLLLGNIGNKEDSEWELILAIFIDKLFLLIENNIKYPED